MTAATQIGDDDAKVRAMLRQCNAHHLARMAGKRFDRPYDGLSPTAAAVLVRFEREARI